MCLEFGAEVYLYMKVIPRIPLRAMRLAKVMTGVSKDKGEKLHGLSPGVPVAMFKGQGRHVK